MFVDPDAFTGSHGTEEPSNRRHTPESLQREREMLQKYYKQQEEAKKEWWYKPFIAVLTIILIVTAIGFIRAMVYLFGG